MKKYSKGRLLSSLVVCLLVVLASFLFSSYTAKRVTDDMWKMLGISQKSGTDEIRSSFFNGYLSYYGARNIKNIALNQRGAIAKDLLNYTKTYVSSPEFMKLYTDLRNDMKPTQPENKPLRSIEAIQKEEIGKTEKSIKDTEKSIKELGPDYAKALQPVLDMLRKNLKDFQNPKHEYFTSLAQGEKYQQDDANRRYKEDMERWQSDYPEDMKAFIRVKLEMMLESTNDIDYNASLVEKYGKKRFVNPAYEGKRTEWKQGFRAGKDVTETARAFARQWLAELGN